MKIIESESISIEGRQLFTIKKMDLKRGSLIAIYGESGTGKTTLLNHLQSKLKDEFKVTTYGQLEITEVKQENLNSNNKSYLLPEEITALKQTLGISELLERDIETLSGGQRQRVILFNKLLVDSDLYLLDEPTSFLDTKTAQKCIKNIKEIAKAHNKCFVIVTHSHDIYDYVDNFYEIKDETLKTVKLDVMEKNNHVIKKQKTIRYSWITFSIFAVFSGIFLLVAASYTNALEEPIAPKEFFVQDCASTSTCWEYYDDSVVYSTALYGIVSENSQELEEYLIYAYNLTLIPSAINECYTNGWAFRGMELPTMENLYSYDGTYYYNALGYYPESTVPYIEYFNQEIEMVYSQINRIINVGMNDVYQTELVTYNEAVAQRNQVVFLALIILLIGSLVSIGPAKKEKNKEILALEEQSPQSFLDEVAAEHNSKSDSNVAITHKKENDQLHIIINNLTDTSFFEHNHHNKIFEYFNANADNLKIFVESNGLLLSHETFMKINQKGA